MTGRRPLTRSAPGRAADKTAPGRAAGGKGSRHPGWIRIGISIVVFAGVAAGSTAYSASLFEEAKQERIAVEESDDVLVDSIYSDCIESQYDPDYDRSRYQQIAETFDGDVIHVDEYLAFEMVDADLDAIREEVAGLDVPIYVAFVASSEVDDADGDLDLIGARIAAELDDEQATVLTIGSVSEGLGHRGVVRRVEERPDLGEINEPYSATGLAWVRALKEAETYEGGLVGSSIVDENGDPIVVNENTDPNPRVLDYPTGSAVAGTSFGLIIGLLITGTGAYIIAAIRHRREGLRGTTPTTNRKG
ncbi:hypothetical protein [Brevibacterium sp.]|uniref:hypothetical protein n=1 Tax=Brevibacterium sp. TaxID=1701 RepID=UPI0028116AB1|nr:hypothetical protein [Brevibacterium sp.]